MHGDDLIFVYGTLRRGGSHHRLLDGARMLGPWTSGPHYNMLDRRIEWDLLSQKERVIGEVYRIEHGMLPALDAYEGCPGDYRRVRITTPYGEAWLYLWDRAAPPAPVVPGGDWLRHLSRGGLRPIGPAAR